jgi:hypothetical protein
MSPDPVLLSFDFLSLRFMLDSDFGSVALICSTEETNTIAYFILYVRLLGSLD